MGLRGNRLGDGYFLALAYAILLVIYAVLLSSSCNTPKRASISIAKWQARHPSIVAEACGVYYPTVSKVEVQERIIKGKSDTINNVVKVDCDTVIMRGNSRVVSVPCPPSTQTTDTFIDHQYHTVVNRAELQALQGKLINAISDKEKFQNQAKTRGKWMWGLAAAWVVFFLLKVLKSYFKL